MKITQLVNDRNNYAANQFVITTKNGVFFQSYETPCAVYRGGVVYLNKDYFEEDFTGGSTTTNKHLYIFLVDYCHFSRWRCCAKEIRRMIEDNEIKMISEDEMEYSKVTQLVNDRNNYAVNQFVITTKNGVFFQSYETPCAVYRGGAVYLNKDYFEEDFTGGSKTTNKHLYIFLVKYCYFSRWRCCAKEIRRMIEDNEIKMISEDEMEYVS